MSDGAFVYNADVGAAASVDIYDAVSYVRQWIVFSKQLVEMCCWRSRAFGEKKCHDVVSQMNVSSLVFLQAH